MTVFHGRLTRACTALIFAWILASCTAVDLFSYNDALVDLYNNKQSARQVDDWVTYETAVSGLADLAHKAAEAAAQEANTANKISLYRVAATASWQGELDGTHALVADGTALCQIKNNQDQVPRDCGMLLVVPALAAIDDTTRRFDALSSELSAAAATTAQRETARGIFKDYHDATALLLSAVSVAEQFSASPGFKKALNDNLATAMRNVKNAYERVRQVERVAVDRDTACKVAALRSAAVAASQDAAVLNGIDCPPGP